MDGPKPAAGLSVNPLPTSDATSARHTGIREANDALHILCLGCHCAIHMDGLWTGKFMKTCTYRKILAAEALIEVDECRSQLREGFAGHREQANIRVRRHGGRNTLPYGFTK